MELPEPAPRHVAAVDLGSNSFHMLVAQLAGGHLLQIDRLRERVALGEGLQEDRSLSPEAEARALDCLERFGERLRGLPADYVRAVGTNTLRQARDTGFLQRAETALGHPIEIISGAEEARLIYLGVSHSVAETSGRRLVVDIGGGSTEVVIGRRFQALIADSLFMGCISYSRQFFPDGKLSHEAFREAEIAARLEIKPTERRLKRSGWSQAIGSSGTVRALEAVLHENDWERHGITLEGLRRIEESLCGFGRTDRIDLQGLEPSRHSVIAGGLAILSGIFRSLEIERMNVSKGALREGVIHDLLGRLQHHDVREETVRLFAERFGVDGQQAARVERTAMLLLDGVREKWQLPEETSTAILLWSARLHEVGMALAWAGYHRHGAYMILNSNMPGFSRQDQRMLAALVQGHRRRLAPELFKDLSEDRKRLFLRLCVVLRLAVCLNRGRSDRPEAESCELAADGDRATLTFGEGSIDDHPLLKADLQREAGHLDAVGIKLKLE